MSECEQEYEYAVAVSMRITTPEEASEHRVSHGYSDSKEMYSQIHLDIFNIIEPMMVPRPLAVCAGVVMTCCEGMNHISNPEEEALCVALHSAAKAYLDYWERRDEEWPKGAAAQ